MNNEERIVVYDKYEIELNKYPRINHEKSKTDIIIIIFLMHEDYLKKLAFSFSEAVKFHNECKEYFYIFNFNKIIRKYSAQDIIFIVNKTNEYFLENNNREKQIAYFNNLQYIDQIFYFYIKVKDFYLLLYKNMESAKKAYFERRDYSYKISPPQDFYTGIGYHVYNALELMEINAYAQYLIQRKIIKDLPTPLYVQSKL